MNKSFLRNLFVFISVFTLVAIAVARAGTQANAAAPTKPIKNSAQTNQSTPGTFKSGQPPVQGGIAGMTAVDTETGLVTESIHGVGTSDNSGTIEVQKPAGATVRKAFLAATSTYDSLNDGDVSIDGSAVSWQTTVSNIVGGNNGWADVTSLVATTLDAAPAGRVAFTIDETHTETIEGEILTVIFNDPSQTSTNTIALLFGAQNASGDNFNVRFAQPIHPESPGFALDMSLGISFSYQGCCQYSMIDANGQRVTTSAGGQDDGEAANGALITVGGLDDSNDNPADPNATPIDTRSDDELYNMVPFVSDGDTTLNVFTQNPSGDDNIFFAALDMKGVAAVVGEGVVLSPPSAVEAVGTSYTATASVQDDNGNPITDRAVHFSVVSGPDAGTTSDSTTDNEGNATFSFVGNSAGTDTIQASETDNNSITHNSNQATVDWTVNEVPTDTPTDIPTDIPTDTPTDVPTDTPTPSQNCSVFPGPSEVTLFADTNYGGSCVTLGIGEYGEPGWEGDLGNDNAESIRTGSNVQATIFEDYDFGGASDTLTTDDPDLSNTSVGDNMISSVIIAAVTPTPDPCLTYTYTQTEGAIVPGVNDTGNHCDDCTTNVELPFAYTLYNGIFTNVQVSSNGNVQFTGSDSEYSNDCLPYSGFDYSIMPHWTDLETVFYSGYAGTSDHKSTRNHYGAANLAPDGYNLGVFTTVTGEAPNRIFYIEWRAVYYDTTSFVNFELALHENAPEFDVIFGEIPNAGDDATVGVQQNSDSALFTEYECFQGGLYPGLEVDYSLVSTNCETPTETPTDTPTDTATDVPTDTPTDVPTNVATLTDTPTGTVCPSSFTESTSLTPVALNSVSCNNGFGHTENHYYRAFQMSSFVPGGSYSISSVDIGVEQATGSGGTQPLSVIVRTSTTNPPTLASLSAPLATADINVPDQSLTLLNVPIAATVSSSSILVVEVVSPDGTAAGNLFFIGSNADGQSAPSYILATDCGLTDITSLAAVGFPDMDIIMRVNGNGTCGVSTDTPTAIATATDTPSDVPTDTATPVPTDTATDVPTDTATSVPTDTATDVPTETPTFTDTPTEIPSDTPTDVPTDTATSTDTNTPVPTDTSTPLPTDTDTPVIKPTYTDTAVPTDTDTPVPSATDTPVIKPTDTNTPVPTDTDTPTSEPKVTMTLTNTPMPTDTVVATDTNTPVPPTSTNTPMPSSTSTSEPTNTDTPTTEPFSTDTPTTEPTSTETPVPCPMNFSDVQPTDWFYTYVRDIFCRGVMSGYSNGTFLPWNNTSRGQMAKIIVLGESWAMDTSGAPHFTDVPTDHPFFQYIETAYNHGVVTGYSDGTYRPGNQVTRAQLSKIVVLAKGWAIDTTGGPHFSDVPVGYPFYSYIETAYNHGIISGYDGSNFRPERPSTRAQIAKIVDGAMNQP